MVTVQQTRFEVRQNDPVPLYALQKLVASDELLRPDHAAYGLLDVFDRTSRGAITPVWRQVLTPWDFIKDPAVTDDPAFQRPGGYNFFAMIPARVLSRAPADYQVRVVWTLYSFDEGRQRLIQIVWPITTIPTGR
jgi:hypothetical protein